MKISQSRHNAILAVLLLAGGNGATNAKTLRGHSFAASTSTRNRALDTTSDETDVGGVQATEKPPQYTSSQTNAIAGFQPGKNIGYTYAMDYENLSIKLLNELLEPVCRSLNENGESTDYCDAYTFVGDPSTSTTIYDADFIQAM